MMKRATKSSGFQQGFTLIEAIVVIVVMGIVVALSAMFIQQPIEAYFDTARRAELTDTADTALRRMARDIRSAVPNSVRPTGSTAIEFLQIRTGGRYRAECSAEPCPVGEDKLDFTSADDGFDFLGSLAPSPVVGDLVVVYNLGIDGATAYAGDNTSAVTGITGNKISIDTKLFPFESPSNRFQVVSGPVSYVCSVVGTNANGDGTGELRRYWGYAISAAPTSGSSALLAGHVSDCSFDYAPGVTARSGLVAISLTLKKQNESVTLYHEVHVSNVP